MSPDPDRHDAAVLLHALALPLARLDAGLRVADANASFCAALGLEHGGLAGRSLPEAIGEPGLRLQHVLAADACPVELQLGDRHWRAAAGALPAGGWALQLSDVTREKAHERERDRLAELLDMAQEFGRVGVWERDPRTLEGRWDRHMFRFFDLPPGDGTPNFTLAARRIHPDDRIDEQFMASLEQPGVHSARYRAVRQNGDVRHLHSQWQVIADAQGRPARVIGILMDDTEVYRLARSAEDANAQLRMALEVAGIATWRHDFASDRVFYDAQGFRTLGLQPRNEGFALEEVRSWIHPEDVAAVQASAERALATGQPVDISARYRHADGSWRDVLARRVVQRDAQGRAIGFIGVGLDMTEQVDQARRAARLAERLDRSARHARIGLWSTTLDALPDWNELMYELFGLDPRQGPLRFGDWLRQAVHPLDRERVAEESRGWLVHGQGPYEVEFRVAGDGDRPRWVVVRGDRDSAPDGPRRLYGIAIDVTAHHEALEGLSAAAERAALLSSSVGIGTWEHDSLTDTVRWDEQMYRLRGLDPESDREPEEPARFVHPDDRERVRGLMRQVLHSRQPSSHEFRVVLPDGTVRWLASRSSPVFDGEGRMVRRIGVNWDITDARTAELALRERELALRESRSKSRFLARMSHELRTPLNAVLGFTRLLLGDADAEPAQRQRRLEHVRDAGEHLLALIDDVLDLSSLEGGELRLALEPVPLRLLVLGTLPLVELAAADRRVKLHADGLDARVFADERRLRQVLLNLLSNAVKYNRDGGWVRVSARRELQDDGERVVLAVADSGRGIAPEQLQRLFQPFERLGAENEGIEGTGIGLTIVKALVECMGGTLRVSSSAGEGSVFEVVLRAAGAAGPVQSQPAESLPAQRSSRPRVLYIEDNEVNTMIVAALLSQRPALDFESARTGSEGLARLLADPPDLVLMDMHLPDMDGHSVLQQLRADARTSALPCVAVSANAISEDIERALAAGFLAYWTKPIDFAAVLDWIDGFFAIDAGAGR